MQQYARQRKKFGFFKYPASSPLIISSCWGRISWVFIFSLNVPICQIQWFGYSWNVKSGSGLGPGPNDWMDNSSSIWVAPKGNLHLKIRKVGINRCCAPVSTKLLDGNVSYTFQDYSMMVNQARIRMLEE